MIGKFKYILLFLFGHLFLLHAQLVTANFIAPDTVCVGQQFTVQNTTTGPATSYYWNFCLGNTNAPPTPTNMGNVGGFNGPVYYTIGKDGTNYYAFVSNNSSGTITRLFYGSSLINNPITTNLGNLGGVVPNNAEDIHLQLENGNWYGIMVGGGGFADRVIRLSFGNSLGNVPTAINMGNIGGLVYPQRLRIFMSGGNYYGFTPNAFGNTITRFNFGASITNIPTGTNLGNIGNLSQPDDIAIINFGGNWYGYIVNEISNSITRLNFGNSLLNTPTAVNIGNTGALNGPRGIDVYVECGQIKGLITNRYSHDLLNMNFTNGPTGPIITTSYGNIANFSFPHSITRFRSGDTLFAMIPNVANNTLSRIYYPNCVSSSIPSSTLVNPPAVSYNAPGIYYISLTVNETQINKSDYCKQVVAVAPPTVGITGQTSYCIGDSIILSGTSPPGCTYLWQGPNNFTTTTTSIIIPNASITNSGTYSLVVFKGACSSTVAVKSLTVNSGAAVNLGNDTNICVSPFSLVLNAGQGSSYLWSGGQTTQTLQVSSAGTYTVKVYNVSGCPGTDTIQITNNALVVNLGNDATLCQGASYTLNAGNQGANYNWNVGAVTQTLSVNSAGNYIVNVTLNGCSSSDTIKFITPSISLGNDITVCAGAPVVLSAYYPSSTYLWSNGATSSSLNVSSSANYWVQVSNSGCNFYDTIQVVINPTPSVNLGNDYFFCQMQPISVTLNAANTGCTYSWNTGATSQTIQLTTPGIYSVQVKNNQGCLSSDIINISRVILNLELGNNLSVCVGTTVQLNAQNQGSTYLWNTGEITQVINVSTSGLYQVQVGNNGCYASDSIHLSVNAPPPFSLGNDTLICSGDVLILSGGAGNNTQYVWNTGSTEPFIEVLLPGYYSVMTTVNGCKVYDEILVGECESEIWVPNSFTPDGDSRNEKFGPVYFNIEKLTMLVFDRWGEVIFHGSGKDAMWDGTFKGKACQEGVYTYKIEYVQKRKSKERIGSITLLR